MSESHDGVASMPSSFTVVGNSAAIVAISSAKAITDNVGIAIDNLVSIEQSLPINDPNRPIIISRLNEARKAVSQFSILIPNHKADLEKYNSKIGEFGTLIKRGAEEPDFQVFFEQNPVFLDRTVKAAYPKKSLGGEFFPDFLLRLDNSSYVAVELEKPRVKLFTNKGDPTAALTHARTQVEDYLKWAIEEKEYLKKREIDNLTADNIRGLVVMGDSKALSPKELRKLEGINATVRSKYEIKTFDMILEENASTLANLKKMN